MTDPDDVSGSLADRRFREDLRRRLAEIDDDQGDAPVDEPRPSAGPVRPAARSAGTTTAGTARSRTDRFLDWAPLGVAVLAIVAIVGIAIYGLNGGDLGPWDS